VVGPASVPGPDIGTRLHLSRDVCFALEYLHAQEPSVVHGDIKPSNVLVESLGGAPHAKLADFGLSRLMTRRAKPLGGTRMWVAPEVLLGRATPAPSSDVFSFGRLFFMTMNAGLPPEYTSTQRPVRILQEGASVTDVCLQLFEESTRLDPEERPTTQELLCRLPGSPNSPAVPSRLQRPGHGFDSPPPEQSLQDFIDAARAQAEEAELIAAEHRPEAVSKSSSDIEAPAAQNSPAWAASLPELSGGLLTIRESSHEALDGAPPPVVSV